MELDKYSEVLKAKCDLAENSKSMWIVSAFIFEDMLTMKLNPAAAFLDR